jgi:hypothetical protein
MHGGYIRDGDEKQICKGGNHRGDALSTIRSDDLDEVREDLRDKVDQWVKARRRDLHGYGDGPSQNVCWCCDTSLSDNEEE